MKASKKPQKVLQNDMAKAKQAMKAKGVSGTVKNVSGTKRESVRSKKKKSQE